MIPKKEEASEEAAPETPKEKAGEVSLGQKVDVVPSENKENVYQAVLPLLTRIVKKIMKRGTIILQPRLLQLR